MKKDYCEKLLNKLLSTGADFAEIYEDKDTSKAYNYLDSKLDKISYYQSDGVGLRIAKGTDIYYGSIDYNDLTEVDELASELIKNFNSEVLYSSVKLNDLENYSSNVKIKYEDYDEKLIKDYMKNLDSLIRNKDKRVSQVSLSLIENKKEIEISNHKGIYKAEERYNTRFYINVQFKDGNLTSRSLYNWGGTIGLEILEKDISSEIDRLIKHGIDKLYAKNCVGKNMPVILGPGFGAVIFHEACGHAMEAAATANNQSVLSGKIGEKIATDKVTIIDDGTIKGLWGTTKIDDEGYSTQKNVLIENGILKNYLNDEINNRILNMNITGSSRRENYKFAPVSRMNNTYLKPGTDKIEDMIKSIDFGLYAVDLGGGSVDPETGEFNFACETAYMIRDGKVKECVKGATLLGNTLEILSNVEMISDNLEYGVGNCGASSGWVPVTIGQPTVKISNILVGGDESDK